jgi:hypothetical protein
MEEIARVTLPSPSLSLPEQSKRKKKVRTLNHLLTTTSLKSLINTSITRSTNYKTSNFYHTKKVKSLRRVIIIGRHLPQGWSGPDATNSLYLNFLIAS